MHGSGKDNPFFGRHHSEETKERLREAAVRNHGLFRAGARETAPERALYALLTRLGIEFEKQKKIPGISIPDAIDEKRQVAFYADGDYWHQLPEYVERDLRINKRLRNRGWIVLRFWEHELLEFADLVEEIIVGTYHIPPPRRFAYVAGAYRAATEWGVTQNIERARSMAAQLLAEGDYFPVTPHLMTAHLGGIVEDDVLVEHYIDIIANLCSVVVMLKGWERSEGARKEHDAALRLGIKIIYET